MNKLNKELVQERCYPDLATGCWNWMGSLNTCGYGQIRAGGKNWTSHRASWTVFRGAIPEGLNVLHHCDNPKCCNPEHLYIGTHTDNMRDMIKRKRRSPRGPDKKPRKRRSEITRNWFPHISYASDSCTPSEPQKPPKKSAA